MAKTIEICEFDSLFMGVEFSRRNYMPSNLRYYRARTLANDRYNPDTKNREDKVAEGLRDLHPSPIEDI